MQTFIRDNAQGLTISLTGHGLLLLLMGLNLVFLPAPERPPLQLAIEATVIDMGEIRRREKAEEDRRQAAAAERRKKEQAKIAEQQRVAQAERQRKEEARKAAEEKARKTEEEKVRKAEEARLAEQKRQAEAERKRQEAEQQRRQAEMQANLQREIEAEEQRQAAVASGKLAEYLALIGDRVERNWVQPPSAKPGVECIVHVTQIPGGDVVDVRVGKCNGDPAVVRSIEAAVFNSSPLPPPTDPSLFDRNLRFTFKPEE